MGPFPAPRKHTLAIVAAALLLGAVSAGPAAAVQPPDPDGNGTLTLSDLQGLPSHSELGGVTTDPRSQPSGVTTMGVRLGTNPNQCEGLTEYPHRSGADASVHARTFCVTNTPTIKVSTTLYRVDWWGLNPMVSGSKTGYSKSFIETTPHSGCGNAPMRTYTAYSAHTAIISGITYTAQTGESNSFACS
jgi:hypothetical protein